VNSPLVDAELELFNGDIDAAEVEVDVDGTGWAFAPS
jgi:hypothetical protein